MSDTVGKILNDIFGGDSSGKKEKEIEGHLIRLGISNYTLRKEKNEIFVDLNTDVVINSKRTEECPVKFGTAAGNFIWQNSGLKSLKNFPSIINGDLNISYNKLNTLLVDNKTVIFKVGRTFNCTGNNLKNLKGSPTSCNRLIAINCGLESLEGSPEEINIMIVNHNKLKSLKGISEKLKEIDCSDNLIENLDDSPKGCRVISHDNPVNTEKQIHIEFENFKKGDMVIINKENSKYNGLKAEIREIMEPTSAEPEKQYFCLIKKSDYPEYTNNIGINLKEKYLKKIKEKIEIGEYVIYKNKNSKFNGHEGTVNSINKEDDSVTVRFFYIQNPGLIDKVSQQNKSKVYVDVRKILPEHLEKITKKEEFKNGGSTYDKFNIGDFVYYMGNKVKIIGIHSTYMRNVQYINGDTITVHTSTLSYQKDNKKLLKKGDKIIYVDPNSDYDELKGEITRISGDYVDVKLEKNSKDVYLYNVNINKIEEDIWAAPEKDKFKVNDVVSYGGVRYEIIKAEGNNYYTISSRRGFVYTGIHANKLVSLKEINIKDDFNVGDIVEYKKEKCKITKKDGEFYSLQSEENIGTLFLHISGKLLKLWGSNKEIEKKEKGVFKKGDRIIYINDRDDNYGKHGTIVDVNDAYYRIHYDIMLELENFNLRKSYVYPEDLKHESEGDVEMPDRTENFKKDQTVVYISSGENDRNKDQHSKKGKILYVNKYPINKPLTYDIIFYKEPGENFEKRIYSVPSENIRPHQESFEVGDKVSYQNPFDEEWHGKTGIVKKIGNRKYEVIFNNGEEKLLIYNIDAEDLTKFVKPIGSQVHIDDDIIYTNPDSDYFGCKGLVIDYDIDEDRFSIEIKTKDGSLKKFKKIKDENLELQPPTRKFKKGDKIRYQNANNVDYDGLIGNVVDVKDDGKNPIYEIKLKIDKEYVYISTRSDYLLLLEEASDTKDFKIGQSVRYNFKGSKYDGKIGKYDGERIKDGKNQLCVKFDEGNVFKRVWVDEGTLEKIKDEEEEPIVTTYTKVKKKKKKEKEDPPKPILVYNRRKTAKKAYTKPTEESEDK